VKDVSLTKPGEVTLGGRRVAVERREVEPEEPDLVGGTSGGGR
jgi:hypothetical protein